MSLAAHLLQEEPGKAREGWRGEEEQVRAPLSGGGWVEADASGKDSS